MMTAAPPGNEGPRTPLLLLVILEIRGILVTPAQGLGQDLEISLRARHS